MMTTYRTFKRSARNWDELATARKITEDRGCTIEEARDYCDAYNRNRTAAQIKRGTKMEFEQE